MPAILSPFGSGGGQQPWQFTPESYGALGNGKIASDVSVNGTSVITSPTIAADPAAVGKFIMINGANGATNGPYIGKITAVAGNNVTVSGTAPTATISSGMAVWGTDDTAAINSCLTAASNYAQANQYFAQIIFGAKLYCLASGPTQTGDGATTPTFNSQIPLPFPASNTGRKLCIYLKGAGDAASYPWYDASIPNAQGSCLVSMVQAPASGATSPFGLQSVIGGPTAGAGFADAFANILPTVDGISVVMPWGCQQQGIDLRFCASASVPNASVIVFAANTGNAPLATDISHWANTNAGGINMPIQLNNDDSFMGQVTISGVAGVGVSFSEHFNCQKLAVLNCEFGIFVRDGGGTVLHGAAIVYFSCENTHTAVFAQNSANTQFPINIALMDTEVIDTADINDGGSILTGVIHWADFERTTMTVTGAGNLKIVNDRLAPGAWAGAPAAPASGTAQQNTSFRDATVYVSSTVAITAVVVAGVTTGQTAAAGAVIPVRVPSGASYTITAAGGTQTTHWVLD